MQEINKSYKIVKSKEDVLELMKHIESSEVMAYDTETNSLNMRKGAIVGWSVSGEVGMGYYLPTLIWNPKTQTLDEFVIEGITTTIPLHKKLLNHKKFIKSDFNVSWLDNEKIL